MLISLFGSAFNPPHKNHREVILWAAKQSDKVLLVPSYRHAFGKIMLPYEQRLQMLHAFCKDLNMDNVHIAAVEPLIQVEGLPVYSYNVLDHVQKENPLDTLSLVIGPDNGDNFHKFYRNEDIKSRWGVSVSPDFGPCRSSLIRKAIENGEDVSELLTPTVYSMIKEGALYAV